MAFKISHNYIQSFHSVFILYTNSIAIPYESVLSFYHFHQMKLRLIAIQLPDRSIIIHKYFRLLLFVLHIFCNLFFLFFILFQCRTVSDCRSHRWVCFHFVLKIISANTIIMNDNAFVVVCVCSTRWAPMKLHNTKHFFRTIYFLAS